MPKIRQHIPGYFDGFEPKEADFETLEELLEIDWVKSYLEWDEAEVFCRNGEHLMVADQDRTWWWVVGRVTPPDILDNLERLKC